MIFHQSISGFDKDLLYRFKVILAVVASGHQIDTGAFKMYCWQTAENYVSLYGWYYMCPSMHLILVHGWEIIGELIVPVGMCSEEAQEAIHKFFNKFREHHARKINR